MSYAIVHNSMIYGSGKYGIDMDAYSGPLSIIFDCEIFDNGYQGIFLEQGSQGVQYINTTHTILS